MEWNVGVGTNDLNNLNILRVYVLGRKNWCNIVSMNKLRPFLFSLCFFAISALFFTILNAAQTERAIVPTLAANHVCGVWCLLLLGLPLLRVMYSPRQKWCQSLRELHLLECYT